MRIPYVMSARVASGEVSWVSATWVARTAPFAHPLPCGGITDNKPPRAAASQETPETQVWYSNQWDFPSATDTLHMVYMYAL